MTKSTPYIGEDRNILIQRSLTEEIPEIKVQYTIIFDNDTPTTRTAVTNQTTYNPSWKSPADFTVKLRFVPQLNDAYLEDTETLTLTPGGKATNSANGIKTLTAIKAVLLFTAGTYGGLKRMILPSVNFDYQVDISGYRNGSVLTMTMIVRKNSKPRIVNMLLFSDDEAHDLYITIRLYSLSPDITDNAYAVDASNFIQITEFSPMIISFDMYNMFDKAGILPSKLYVDVNAADRQSLIDWLGAQGIVEKGAIALGFSIDDFASKIAEAMFYMQDEDWIAISDYRYNANLLYRFVSRMITIYAYLQNVADENNLMIPEHFVEYIKNEKDTIEVIKYLAIVAAIDDIELVCEIN